MDPEPPKEDLKAWLDWEYRTRAERDRLTEASTTPPVHGPDRPENPYAPDQGYCRKRKGRRPIPEEIVDLAKKPPPRNPMPGPDPYL
jgi:hypothetical protein